MLGGNFNPTRRVYADGRVLYDVQLYPGAGELPVWTSEPDFWGSNLDVYFDPGTVAQWAQYGGAVFRAYAISGSNKSLLSQGRVGIRQGAGNSGLYPQNVLRCSGPVCDSYQVTVQLPPSAVAALSSGLSAANISVGVYGREPWDRDDLIVYRDPRSQQLTGSAYIGACRISELPGKVYKFWGEVQAAEAQSKLYLSIYDLTGAAAQTGPTLGVTAPICPPIPVTPGNAGSCDFSNSPIDFVGSCWIAWSTSPQLYQTAGVSLGGWWKVGYV